MSKEYLFVSTKHQTESLQKLALSQGNIHFHSLSYLQKTFGIVLSKLPFSIKILLENVLRNCDGKLVTEENLKSLAQWKPNQKEDREIPFIPSRVILQDFTGVPCVADLAAMRNAVAKLHGKIEKVNPLVDVDLVIDHSVQVDFYGTNDSFEKNVEREYERNKERYLFLKWAQNAFHHFRVVPPGMGIVHQVNLEYLSRVIDSRSLHGESVAFPDTLVGTDSHTTMINGLGVLGWGVGGIEAEACMLGQPLFMTIPEVVGFKLTGKLPEGATATDLVLTVTQMLRKKGVVGKFVEFFGSGLHALTLPDRATVANMAPEYGATVGFFPIDAETLRYLQATNRGSMISLVESYAKAQNLFHDENTSDPSYSDLLELNLKNVEPCLAGPKRPQDRVPLQEVKKSVESAINRSAKSSVEVQLNGDKLSLHNGSVVISAITSCTNTSNPSVMLAAGLLAKNAVEHGLKVNPLVKTSLAPGSRVVTDYLQQAGLTPYLEKLGFYLVGYGCTTCIGNSGPLAPPIASAIKENQLTVAAVLSGNRNFEGRIHPSARLSYLASPPLVIAYALAGKMDIDLVNEPIGKGNNGKSVFLKEIWPTTDEVNAVLQKAFKPELFKERYSKVFEGNASWDSLAAPDAELYQWDPKSTYILEPPFFKNLSLHPSPLQEISGGRVLALLGDSITTDHISPAGSIASGSPAASYLKEHGVEQKQFNTYGARRGNHEVMVRGTFANIRLKNLLLTDVEGGMTRYLPTNEIMSIYDAAMRYRKDGVPLLIIAGKEYGSGSSRDWAAKGTMMLGVKAVLAESFERIHRSNLVGMGVLPLEFMPGENRLTHGLTGEESYEIQGASQDLVPFKVVTIYAKDKSGKTKTLKAKCRLDSQVDVEYYRNGGILTTVFRQVMR